MNKTYRLIWNTQHFCWQAVSEIVKSGGVKKQSTTQRKLKKNIGFIKKIVALFAINLLSASIAFAGPTGGIVSSMGSFDKFLLST